MAFPMNGFSDLLFQTTLSQGHSPPRLSVNRPQLPALGVAGGPAPAVGGGGASAGAVSPPQLPTKPTLAPPQTPPRASSVASAGKANPPCRFYHLRVARCCTRSA